MINDLYLITTNSNEQTDSLGMFGFETVSFTVFLIYFYGPSFPKFPRSFSAVSHLSRPWCHLGIDTFDVKKVAATVATAMVKPFETAISKG